MEFGCDDGDSNIRTGCGIVKVFFFFFGLLYIKADWRNLVFVKGM